MARPATTFTDSMNTEVIPLTERLLSALLTGCYQGLLITGIVWLCLKLSPRANAATRYATWCVTLGTVAALPILHFAVSSQAPPPQSSNREPGSIRPETAAKAAFNPMFEPSAAPFESTEAAAVVEGNSLPPEVSVAMEETAEVTPHTPGEAPIETAEPSSRPIAFSATAGDHSTAESGKGLPGFMRAAVRALEGIWANRLGAVSLPASHATGIIVLAAVGALAAVRLGALFLQLGALQRLRKTSTPAPGWLQDQFRAVARQAGLHRPVELRVSDEAHSPMVVGLHPPAVLIPERLLAAPEPTRLNPVLRHEIAHLQRWDDWINLAQQAVRALFGFHPAVLWISRRISIEREIACDDRVLHAGQKPREYALFLTEFATQDRSRVWTAAPAAWTRKSQLTERVNMILQTNRSISPRVGRTRLGFVTATLAGCAVLMLAAAPRVSLGDQPEVPPPPSAPALPEAPISVDLATKIHMEPVVAEVIGVPLVQPPPGTPVPVALPPQVVTQTGGEPVYADVVAVQMAGAPVAIVTAGPADRRVAQSGPRPKGDPDYEPPRRTPEQPAGSIEERLERLERMVEKLVNEPRPGARYAVPPQPGVMPQPHPAPAKPMAPAAPRALPERAPKAPGAANNPLYIPEDGERQELAIKRADPDRTPSEFQLRALENRRKALEQQIAVLEGQLHQLEKQQDELEREREKMEHEREMQLRERDRAREEREAANRLREAQRERDRIQREEQRRNQEQEKQKPSSNNAPAKESSSDAEDEAKSTGVRW